MKANFHPLNNLIARRRRKYYYKDIEKSRRLKRESRLRHLAKTRERQRKQKNEHRKKVRKYLTKLKRIGCKFCKEKNSACLDFHHKVTKNKLSAIMLVAKNKFGLLNDEIKKCVVVCANCHRKIHYTNIPRYKRWEDAYKILRQRKEKNL